MHRGLFKFPHTPHLWWPLSRPPKDDRVLDGDAVAEILSSDVVIEEKVDGANIGLSLDDEGAIRSQNRGSFVTPGSHPQFNPMGHWISMRSAALTDLLQGGRVLFGEWCFAVHSIQYDRLPDWLLGFDVYDQEAKRFFSTPRRNEALKLAGVCEIPRLFAGRVTLVDLQRMLLSEQSRVGKGPLEGHYVRRESERWLERRAKLVRPEFLLGIGEHWSHSKLKRNTLAQNS